MTTLIESEHFNDLRIAWFPNLGFFLEMVHGGVLNPRTGELWPDVTTLVTLSNPSVTRGYRAGRVWFFYEAGPDERRLTDTYLMQRLHELAVERHQYQDEANTINFALGCLIGELSGQLFPLMQEEHESIQEEDHQFMIEYKVQWTKAARSAIPNLCT